MSAAAADALRGFVEALTISDDGALLLAGSAIARVGDARDDADRLATLLAPAVYVHGYCRAYPPPPPIVSRDITAELERANGSRARMESDWSFSARDNQGSVIATRHGRTRRLSPGQFMPRDGVLPLAPGAALVVQFPAGSRTAQPGFFYCFGDAFRDANDLAPLVRLYWHVQAEGAVPLTAALTRLLNRYRIPFEFKVAVDTAELVRRDAAVLYLSQDHYPVAATLLGAAWPLFAPHLGDDVPLFARQLAPGLGLAEDPGGGTSFGMARSELVAKALARSSDGARFAFDRFAGALDAAITEAGLRADALWCNPGSPDLYEALPLVAERHAA